MRTGPRIAAFVTALAVVFAVAVWVGRSFGPKGDVTAAVHPAGHDAGAAAQPPGGLQASQGGYTLELAQSLRSAEPNSPLEFRILDEAGTPVVRFEESHEELLHLIVVRNDLTGYQHLHPVLDDRGTWRVPVDFSRAGDYRVFADFLPAGGPALTLSANVHVAGPYQPQPLPAVDASSTVGDYTVTLRGTPKAAEPSTLTLTVNRNGTPVDDLQPYLGAYGHLVALRAADLAYLHVHPIGEPGDGVTPAGPAVDFHTTFHSAGEYRLFLDFKHRDEVRTAEFTVSVEPSGQQHSPTQDHGGDGHGH
ncbi:hypothetical protein A5765_07995 [Mycolicibacterium celeriflavum]|uniref:hypothetical protein n=1 Tax=Mycolicibacterium celeriflavum TaxID=1249101 RepID=UPI0007FED7AB|nr:hypothetical protein [Mycolicibacterium celeriflavum]OBG16646.1 hypothetical protein A5765_07995 [Mycolicibacterium celeriflavum]